MENADFIRGWLMNVYEIWFMSQCDLILYVELCLV